MTTNTWEQLQRWGSERPASSSVLDTDQRALAAWLERAPRLNQPGPAHERPSVHAEYRRQLKAALKPFVRTHLHELLDGAADCGVSQLLAKVARRFPWLVPSAQELSSDAQRQLRDKVGFEYKSAILLSEVLADPRHGSDLAYAARRPTQAARQVLPEFVANDQLKLEGAQVRREGQVGYVEIASPNTLNAEDEQVLSALETCVDLALLDERIQVCVLRGASVSNVKYAGRRVFCSGINLSALYGGKLGYLYYVERELGLVSKIYRGVALEDGQNLEKPWIAAVDTHAIGGGCQLLLVMDYVIAARGATLSLPARREGIIPGAANLRIARFLGELHARRALLMDQAMAADSELGRRLVDHVVEAHEIDDAVSEAAHAFVSSGHVSLAANRQGLRIAQEPLSLFVEYMAFFALAQAECHFSPALVANLERNWLARKR